MSEPDAGSDVRGMKGTAVRDGDEHVINGTKGWIASGTARPRSNATSFRGLCCARWEVDCENRHHLQNPPRA